MIFAFIEDGTLDVVSDADEARREYEGVDVESGVIRFYDERGTPLSPRFTVPNRRGRFLGLFPWVSSGVYDLAPDPDTPCDSFALALRETVALAPNRWFASLDELRDTLRARGVPVDHA